MRAAVSTPVRPFPMTLVPSPYARIVLEGLSGRVSAQLVCVSPWPGLPAGWSGDLPYTQLHQWRCCGEGPEAGLITDVVLHLPINVTDPAFTVKISVDDTGIGHHLDKHGFLPA
jgi:hypothetical protein